MNGEQTNPLRDSVASAGSIDEIDSPLAARNRRIKLVVILIVLAVVLYVGGNGMQNAWKLQRKLDCGRNMHAIAIALKHYGESEPAWSDQATTSSEILAQLVRLGAITHGQTICPVAQSDHSNYVLSKESIPSNRDNRFPLIWEPLSNHGGEGANVYFADGHTAFVEPSEFNELTDSGE